MSKTVPSAILIAIILSVMPLLLASPACATTSPTVTLTAIGLPQSDSWSVEWSDINHLYAPGSVNVNAGTSSVSVQIANNTYDFVAQDTSNGNFPPYQVQRTVSGNTTIDIYFNISKPTTVTVSQRGLPANTTWSGSIVEGANIYWSWNNSLSRYSFQLEPGLYEYLFNSVTVNNTTYNPTNPSGYFTLYNKSYNLTAAYAGISGQTYGVGFYVHNLTAYSDGWFLTVDGVQYSSNQPSLLLYLTAGYHTIAGEATGGYVSNSETILVVSTGNSVNLTFYRPVASGPLAYIASLLHMTPTELLVLIFGVIGLAIGFYNYLKTDNDLPISLTPGLSIGVGIGIGVIHAEPVSLGTFVIAIVVTLMLWQPWKEKEEKTLE